MTRLSSVATAISAILLLGAGSAQAAVIFSDSFEGDAIAIPATSLTNFDIVSGSVDVIGTGSAYNFFPSSGHFLDLDGTTSSPNNPASVLTSKALFGPGTYTVSFDLAGSQREDGPNTTVVSLGGDSFTQTLTSGQGLTRYSFTATVTGAPSALTFTETGRSDNVGNILDNVSVSSVPLPASAPMFGAALLALAGFGFALNRRTAPKGHAA